MMDIMSAISSADKATRAARAQVLGAKSVLHDPRQFWAIDFKRQTASLQTCRRALHVLVDRVIALPGVVLSDAVESNVPTSMVDLLAGATGEPVTRVLESSVCTRPPDAVKTKPMSPEPLPNAAGHRVMGFLRVMATLRRLLEDGGDPQQLARFDL